MIKIESIKIFIFASMLMVGSINLLAKADQDFLLDITSSTLKFHSNWTYNFNNLQQLPEFHEALKSEAFTEIDIGFYMSSGFGDEQIKKIFPHPFKQYKQVKLNLGSTKIGKKGVQYVLSLIPQGVQILQIDLDSIPIDVQTFQLISNKLNELKSLTKLKISMILSSLNSQSLSTFFKTHKISSVLKQLRLVFIGNQLKGDSLANFEQYVSQNNLEIFGFNLYANNIEVEGSSYLAAGIKKLNKVYDLDIDVYFNKIIEDGATSISQAIGELTNLKKLWVNFDFNYIKNEGGKQLGAMLKNIPQLDELMIGVASKNFGYLGFKGLVDGMHTQRDLKILRFRCGINRVGYNGAGIVNKMIEDMPNLHTLVLGFVQNYIGDDGLVEIAQTVTKHPNLKQIDLDLGFNDARSYGGINTLKTLGRKKWEYLDLRLSHNQFRDSDIKLMKPYIKTILNTSKAFIFEFMDTAMSKVMMADLKSFFEKHANQDSKMYVNSIIPEEEQKQAEQKDERSPFQQSEEKQKQKAQELLEL